MEVNGAKCAYAVHGDRVLLHRKRAHRRSWFLYHKAIKIVERERREEAQKEELFLRWITESKFSMYRWNDFRWERIWRNKISAIGIESNKSVKPIQPNRWIKTNRPIFCWFVIQLIPSPPPFTILLDRIKLELFSNFRKVILKLTAFAFHPSISQHNSFASLDCLIGRFVNRTFVTKCNNRCFVHSIHSMVTMMVNWTKHENVYTVKLLSCKTEKKARSSKWMCEEMTFILTWWLHNLSTLTTYKSLRNYVRPRIYSAFI